MTLSVVDGSFPREVLASRNLTFSQYKMPSRRNKREFYDAKTFKPGQPQPGAIHFGEVSFNEASGGRQPAGMPIDDAKAMKISGLTPAARQNAWSLLVIASGLCVGGVIGLRRRRKA